MVPGARLRNRKRRFSCKQMATGLLRLGDAGSAGVGGAPKIGFKHDRSVGESDKGGQILAAGAHRAAQSRRRRYHHCLRRRTDRISRGDRDGVSPDPGARPPSRKPSSTWPPSVRPGTNDDPPLLGHALGAADRVFRLPAGDPQGHLHDQRHRAAEQLDAKDPQDPSCLPQRRRSSGQIVCKRFRRRSSSSARRVLHLRIVHRRTRRSVWTTTSASAPAIRPSRRFFRGCSHVRSAATPTTAPRRAHPSARSTTTGVWDRIGTAGQRGASVQVNRCAKTISTTSCGNTSCNCWRIPN